MTRSPLDVSRVSRDVQLLTDEVEVPFCADEAVDADQAGVRGELR